MERAVREQVCSFYSLKCGKLQYWNRGTTVTLFGAPVKYNRNTTAMYVPSVTQPPQFDCSLSSLRKGLLEKIWKYFKKRWWKNGMIGNEFHSLFLSYILIFIFFGTIFIHEKVVPMFNSTCQNLGISYCKGKIQNIRGIAKNTYLLQIEMPKVLLTAYWKPKVVSTLVRFGKSQDEAN